MNICVFFPGTIDYRANIIWRGKWKVSEQAGAGIEAVKPPTTATELRSFCGGCNVIRRIIPKLACVSAPLNKELRRDQTFNFGDLIEGEMNALTSHEKSLNTPPVLSLPRAEGKMPVDTAFCDTQIGCVLLQEKNPRKSEGSWILVRFF